MARDKKQPDSSADVDPNARLTTSEKEQAKARKWFARADELVDNRNYDYAIECYVDGLALWPEAVEEGHKKLRGCGAARQHTGGKKASLKDTMKRSMNHKDPVQAMLNASWLLAHDPMNISYIEGVFKNANRAHCDDTVMWIGQSLANAAEQEKKPSAKRFAFLKDIYEELADRAQARGEVDLAVEALQRGVDALNIQEHLDPKNTEIPTVRRDLSTKLTILKGKYQTSESFTESIRDRESQDDLRDGERMVQSSDRLGELIAKAQKDMEDNPGVPGKVRTLVDLLCREDDPERERQAIGILVEQFKETGDYQHKSQADDIRARQLARAVRDAKMGDDRAAIKEARVEQLKFELRVYKERVGKYPTDHRLRFEYASRLFQARKFDDAIPLFQTARADPKHRARCDAYIGRCFFERGYHDQAVATLSKAIEGMEVPDNETGKAIQYWLGRSQEAAGDRAAALGTFGRLMQLDYNYRDIRARMDSLKD